MTVASVRLPFCIGILTDFGLDSSTPRTSLTLSVSLSAKFKLLSSISRLHSPTFYIKAPGYFPTSQEDLSNRIIRIPFPEWKDLDLLTLSFLAECRGPLPDL